MENMTINIPVQMLRRILLRVWLLLLLGGFVAVFSLRVLHIPENNWIEFIGLSFEENLPTWYASTLLTCCAILLGLIATATRSAGKRYVWHWWILSASFLYISIDENVDNS